MTMTSKERVLGTIDGRAVDHTPVCTFLFSELQARCADQAEFIARQMELGVDVIAALPDPATAFHPDVHTEYSESPGDPHPLMRQVYHTPAGDLETIVARTGDWPHRDRIPLMTDYVIPRARKFLVTGPEDLGPLGYLLRPPAAEAIVEWRGRAAETQRMADRHGLAVRGAFHRLGDMICWLCGCEAFATMGRSRPEFFQALVDLIAAWQESYIRVYLEAKPDLLVDAQWYATTFLSPALYDRFIAPAIARRVAMAHGVGARFCTVATTNVMPFFECLKRLGIDMLVGVDPIQGQWDFARTKAELGEAVCLAGGVNAYLTIVDGTPEMVEQAVERAMAALAPGGRFILGPVDDIRIDGPKTPEAWQRVWTNLEAMVEAWRRLR